MEININNYREILVRQDNSLSNYITFLPTSTEGYYQQTPPNKNFTKHVTWSRHICYSRTARPGCDTYLSMPVGYIVVHIVNLNLCLFSFKNQSICVLVVSWSPRFFQVKSQLGRVRAASFRERAQC